MSEHCNLINTDKAIASASENCKVETDARMTSSKHVASYRNFMCGEEWSVVCTYNCVCVCLVVYTYTTTLVTLRIGDGVVL